VVTTTGREAVDRYETPQSNAAAAHFDMGSTIVKALGALSSHNFALEKLKTRDSF
jgi:hypothetical protein